MKKFYLILIPLLVFFASCEKQEIENQGEFSSIVLNDSVISIIKGGKHKIVFDGSKGLPTWKISDNTIVQVDSLGVITTAKVGDAYITKNLAGVKTVYHIKVVDSPLQNLKLPDINNSTSGTTKIIIEGTGFAKDCKIYLRKITTESSSKAPASAFRAPASDMLATIHEVASDYIQLTANVSSEGWYYLLLDNGDGKFNLGNLYFKEVKIPEYAYDKSKIFWDDTHLRWMQLRGPVKEMKVAQIDLWGTTLSPMTVYYLFRFNNKGYLTSSLSSWIDSISIQYDSSNRITEMISFDGSNSLSRSAGSGSRSKCTFTYGNHNKYYRIGFNDVGYDPFFCYMADVNFGMGDNFYEGFWVKGLTGTTSNDATFNISIFIDSIVTKESYRTNYNYSTSLYYNGSFPNLEIRKIDNNGNYSSGNIYKTFYSFSNNGQITKYLTDHYYKPTNNYYKNYDSIEYKSNTPFQQYTIKHEGSAVGGVRKFKYDKNFNVIEDEWTLDSGGTVITSYYNYVSYDKYGNWTQCVVIENDNRWPDNDDVWKLKREFTYW